MNIVRVKQSTVFIFLISLAFSFFLVYKSGFLPAEGLGSVKGATAIEEYTVVKGQTKVYLKIKPIEEKNNTGKDKETLSVITNKPFDLPASISDLLGKIFALFN